ncbi:LPS-assembly lipoprotein [Azomonas agilis]|uniref:LPS-assembly lipoprotein LptE n=1 Tax=Azomonas agilis TaxID=116849 RepID=A0A562I1L3_9GAMM|nr:LPS assembly lipoprotein LptE [Azomonas agilis]TWH64565.1 LPS-assembly lipoprotein [Azomonas agilis]
MLMRLLTVLGIALLLSACGFHLRGTGGGGPLALSELNLVSRDVYGDTQRLMRQTLESYQVKVTPTAAYTLNLVQEKVEKRTATQTSSSRTAEYELINQLDFQIQTRNGLTLLTERSEVRKTYVYDANNLIGSDQEANLVRQELRGELVQQVFMRLQRITLAQLEQLQQKAEAKAKAEAEALEAARRAEEAEANRPKASPIEPAP